MLKKNYFVRIMRYHQRLYASLAVGLLVALFGAQFGITFKITRALIGYDIATLIYIFWALWLMSKSTILEIKERSLTHEDGKFEVLFLVTLALIFSVGAIFADLASVKYLAGYEKYEKLFVGLITIILSWFFTNIVFALHYTHDYYFDRQKNLSGGLVFLPENEEPEYFDFIYFSFILGATAQTSDVILSSKKMRRTCTLHSILSFFFNTSLLAITINMASGLF